MLAAFTRARDALGLEVSPVARHVLFASAVVAVRDIKAFRTYPIGLLMAAERTKVRPLASVCDPRRYGSENSSTEAEPRRYKTAVIEVHAVLPVGLVRCRKRALPLRRIGRELSLSGDEEDRATLLSTLA